MRWFITYKFRNKIRIFSTQAPCEQVAVWEFSKDKAHKDSDFISCLPEHLYHQSKPKNHPKKHKSKSKAILRQEKIMRVNEVDTLEMQGRLNDVKHYLRYCNYDVSDSNIDDFNRAVKILDGVISQLNTINFGEANEQHPTHS